ncbi:MAG TPA: Spy/CpxP family protein refolding chaperone [Pyrinomonadaceae bacterium]|nr:Spy/CpxP family protein refolding chaperone [Pyrinomonadaceae bacterium]
MQLNRTRKIVGGLALAGTMALSGIVGFAQQGTTQGTQGDDKGRGAWGRGEHGGHKRGGRGMHGGGLGRFAEKLNLTDAQKAQMEQITARYRETAKAGREQRQARGARGGFDPFNGGTFNESEVRAAAQARANARVEREVAHARMMSELYAVLTAEQKAQLTAERQQREQRRQERRMRRNADGVAPASRT